MTPERFEKLVGEFIMQCHCCGTLPLRCSEIAAEFKRDAEEAKGVEQPEEDDPRVEALSPLARELHDRCTSVMHPNEWEAVAGVVQEKIERAIVKAGISLSCSIKKPTPPADDEGLAERLAEVWHGSSARCVASPQWKVLAAHVRKMIDAAVQAEHDAGLKMIAAVRTQHAIALRSAKREAMLQLLKAIDADCADYPYRSDAVARNRMRCLIECQIAALDAEGKS